MAMMADAFPADFRAAGKRRRTQAPSDLYSAKFHAAERLRRAADNAETLRLSPVGHDAHIVPDPTSTAAPTDTRSVTQPPYDASAPTASDPFTHSSGSFAPSSAAFTHSSGKLPAPEARAADPFAGAETYADYQAAIAQNYKAQTADLAGSRLGRTLAGGVETAVAGYVNAAGTVNDYLNQYYAAPTAFRPDGTVDWEASVKAQRPSQTVQDAVDALHAGADALRSRGAQHITEAKDGLGWFGQRLVDAGASGVQMLGDAALNALAPGAGLAAMGVRAFGSAAGDARRDGADVSRQMLYGLANAAVEALTEKLTDIPGIYGGGWLDDAAKKVVDKWIASPVLKYAAKAAASAAGESLEEAAAGLVEPGLRSIYNGKGFARSYAPEDWADMGNAAFSAAILGALGGLSPNAQATQAQTEAAAGRSAPQPLAGMTRQRYNQEQNTSQEESRNVRQGQRANRDGERRLRDQPIHTSQRAGGIPETGSTAGERHPAGGIRQETENAGEARSDTPIGPRENAKDKGALGLTYGEEVDASYFGIKDADITRKFRIVTGGDTPFTKAAKIIAGQHKLVLYAGNDIAATGNGNIESIYHPGTDTICAPVDDPYFTAPHFVGHERCHAEIRRGKVNTAKVLQEAEAKLPDGFMDHVKTAYEILYPDYSLSQNLVELVCDAAGKMNRIRAYGRGYSNLAVVIDKVLSSIHETLNEETLGYFDYVPDFNNENVQSGNERSGVFVNSTSETDHPLPDASVQIQSTDAAPPPPLTAALETLKTLGDTPAGRRARSAAEAAAQAFRYIREAAQRSDEAAYATALGVLRHSTKELSDLAASGALPEDAARAANHVAAKAKDLPGKATELQRQFPSSEGITEGLAESTITNYNGANRMKEGANDAGEGGSGRTDSFGTGSLWGQQQRPGESTEGMDGRAEADRAGMSARGNAEEDEGVRSTVLSPRDRETGNLKYGNEVSAVDFGLPYATDENRVRLVVSGETKHTRRAKAVAGACELILYGGGTLSIQGNGMIEAFHFQDRIGVPVDDPNFTSDQYVGHELAHRMLRSGELSLESVLQKVFSLYPETEEIIDGLYALLYPKNSKLKNRIEFICDAAGNMNRVRADYGMPDNAALVTGMDAIIRKTHLIVSHACGDAFNEVSDILELSGNE